MVDHAGLEQSSIHIGGRYATLGLEFGHQGSVQFGQILCHRGFQFENFVHRPFSRQSSDRSYSRYPGPGCQGFGYFIKT